MNKFTIKCPYCGDERERIPVVNKPSLHRCWKNNGCGKEFLIILISPTSRALYAIFIYKIELASEKIVGVDKYMDLFTSKNFGSSI